MHVMCLCIKKNSLPGDRKLTPRCDGCSFTWKKLHLLGKLSLERGNRIIQETNCISSSKNLEAFLQTLTFLKRIFETLDLRGLGWSWRDIHHFKNQNTTDRLSIQAIFAFKICTFHVLTEQMAIPNGQMCYHPF